LLLVHLYRYVFFFFFSSRRRHTRFSRDWSSDVCSSDLADIQFEIGPADEEFLNEGKGNFQFINDIFGGAIPKEFIPAIQKGFERSEERRVGKESRSWRATGN